MKEVSRADAEKAPHVGLWAKQNLELGGKQALAVEDMEDLSICQIENSRD